eukprot:7761721-Pyramimonas_sp.AAC.1
MYLQLGSILDLSLTQRTAVGRIILANLQPLPEIILLGIRDDYEYAPIAACVCGMLSCTLLLNTCSHHLRVPGPGCLCWPGELDNQEE